MFKSASSFNQDIELGCSNVTTCMRCLKMHHPLIRILGIGMISNLLACMRCLDASFNQDISDWNVSVATNMTNMFQDILLLSDKQRFNPPIILISQLVLRLEEFVYWMIQTSDSRLIYGLIIEADANATYGHIMIGILRQ